MIIGVLSDTHGSIDLQLPADDSLKEVFRSVDLLIHAGDVGHHGGHKEVREALEVIAPVQCVRGNVDEAAPTDEFPAVRVVQAAGWRIVVTHICGHPPSQEAKELAKEQQADILIFGHSHKYSEQMLVETLFLNPGSAGAARFKLPRTVAILRLPEKASLEKPSVERVALVQKAKLRSVKPKPVRSKPRG